MEMELLSSSKLRCDGTYVSPLGNNISDLYEPSTDEWVVEEILDVRLKNVRVSRRIYKKVKEYLVLWKGYPQEDASWEPEEHLQNCKNKLKKFHKNQLKNLIFLTY
jgi:hypothetical protein